VVIVGAGPAGITATLRAIEHKLDYVTLERETIGGTVAKYPRQKLVMTSPVEFPMGVHLKKTQLSKESLLEFWKTICNHKDFRVQEHEVVEHIQKLDDGTELISGILKIRGLSKQYGTYFKGIPDKATESYWKDGMVYGQFNQCVATTGRLSSSGPNMQNIPESALTMFTSRFE